MAWSRGLPAEGCHGDACRAVTSYPVFRLVSRRVTAGSARRKSKTFCSKLPGEPPAVCWVWRRRSELIRGGPDGGPDRGHAVNGQVGSPTCCLRNTHQRCPLLSCPFVVFVALHVICCRLALPPGCVVGCILSITLKTRSSHRTLCAGS